jgi:hypothetical protein
MVESGDSGGAFYRSEVSPYGREIVVLIGLLSHSDRKTEVIQSLLPFASFVKRFVKSLDMRTGVRQYEEEECAWCVSTMTSFNQDFSTLSIRQMTYYVERLSLGCNYKVTAPQIHRCKTVFQERALSDRDVSPVRFVDVDLGNGCFGFGSYRLNTFAYCAVELQGEERDAFFGGSYFIYDFYYGKDYILSGDGLTLLRHVSLRSRSHVFVEIPNANLGESETVKNPTMLPPVFFFGETKEVVSRLFLWDDGVAVTRGERVYGEGIVYPLRSEGVLSTAANSKIGVAAKAMLNTERRMFDKNLQLSCFLGEDSDERPFLISCSIKR